MYLVSGRDIIGYKGVGYIMIHKDGEEAPISGP